ncbi:MAG TPA: STAS domain-containing protein [Ktedonobacteraceae bacterium]|nr:STAS domain-containing protein [Ktedonobacteraceae bacterium]
MMHMRPANARTSIIDIQGNMPALESEAFRAMHAQDRPLTNAIILNCSQLESINSRAICELVQLLIYARQRQQRLLVFGLSEYNRYLLKITGLSEFIEIADTETHAVAAAG